MSQTKAQLIEGSAASELTAAKTLLGAGSASAPSLAVTGDTNTGIYFPTADTIGFTEGGVEAARIDSSGRLLVGTSTARANFDNGATSTVLQVEGVTTDTRRVSIISSTADDAGGALLIAHQRSGTIGGNTVLQVNDTFGTINFQGSDGTEFVTGAVIQGVVDGTPGANDMPGRLVFSTTADGASSPTERMRITNGGLTKFTTDGSYTDIDTSVHGFRQTINGQWILMCPNTTANPYGLRISYTGSSPNGTSNPAIEFADSSAQRFQVRSNGGIANYSGNNVNLSDINAKKDITPAAGTWDCLKDWEIVNFRYKDQSDDADLNLGVIAQQVAESCPEVITVFQEAKEATEDQPAQEERLGVKDQQMMWMAIKALQEAQLRIEALEAEVTALKAQ